MDAAAQRVSSRAWAPVGRALAEATLVCTELSQSRPVQPASVIRCCVYERGLFSQIATKPSSPRGLPQVLMLAGVKFCRSCPSLREYDIGPGAHGISGAYAHNSGLRTRNVDDQAWCDALWGYHAPREGSAVALPSPSHGALDCRLLH
ncbi:hypothetical protein GY45DRAFT_544548 [Cubamyces sp. BRFM 1775]|nr:hypothetical protein GY45DRAFT_544548 [Cubamyces sp. BRFM 1775]